MRLLPLMILVAGCATTAADGETRDQRELAADLEGRTAGAPQACIPVRQGQSMRIVDRRTIVYREFDTIYVNRLDAACPGLRPHSTLVVEVHGSQYCRGDRVRAVEPGSSIPGPFCQLRDFVPYRENRGG
jgi:hypothetical protein